MGMNMLILRRWQWAAIGLIMGAAAGGISNMFAQMDVETIPSSIHQKQFEDDLKETAGVSGTNAKSRLLWKDIHVVRVADPYDRSRLAYVVKGQHFERTMGD